MGTFFTGWNWETRQAETDRLMQQGTELLTLFKFRLGFKQFIFQQDEGTRHTAKISKEGFQDNSANSVLERSGQGRDLNPIEVLWRDLHRRCLPSNHDGAWKVLQRGMGEPAQR